MSIFVVGLNHKTAPITLREKFYFPTDKLSLYLQDLLTRGIAQEAVLLSTCNRSELYCTTDEVITIQTWFAEQSNVSPEELNQVLYVYENEKAIEHIMQVACGLDSMILGEPQILGQLKEAFSESCTAGAISGLFHRLFQQTFMIAKEIRTTTAIGACPVSVAHAAVRFAEKLSTHFNEANVVMIGAGEATELLMRYLTLHIKRPICLLNRSVEKAVSLIRPTDRLYGLDQLKSQLIDADIVFSATGSPMPIVSKELMVEVMRERAEKPIILIDIAVPRDIEADIKNIANVQLYCIDDLKAIIETNRQGREHAAEKARELIVKKSHEMMLEIRSLDTMSHAIRSYRRQIEEICRGELVKAKRQLHRGDDPLQVLDAFAHAFTRKLLHAPSVQLRQAAVAGRLELLSLAKQLFAMPEAEVSEYEAINSN